MYTAKVPVTAADILNDRALPFFENHMIPVIRVLTDRGTEYCGAPEKHLYELFLQMNDIEHTMTKAKSPQTNGICERFNQTILNDFINPHLEGQCINQLHKCRKIWISLFLNTTKSEHIREEV